MKTVAIIGGGITGLTAAFRLKQKGIPVTVYEAGPRVGGVIQCLRRDGYLAEFGPNSIMETSPKISTLVRDLDLEAQKIYSDARAETRFILRDGKPMAVPGAPLTFLTSRLFSVKAKSRLMLEPFIRRAPADIEESVAQFVERRLGTEFLDSRSIPSLRGFMRETQRVSRSSRLFRNYSRLSRNTVRFSWVNSLERANERNARRFRNRMRKNSRSMEVCKL